MPPDLQWVAGLVEPVRLLRPCLDQYFHVIWHCNEKAIGYYLLCISNNLSCIHADSNVGRASSHTKYWNGIFEVVSLNWEVKVNLSECSVDAL